MVDSSFASRVAVLADAQVCHSTFCICTNCRKRLSLLRLSLSRAQSMLMHVVITTPLAAHRGPGHPATFRATPMHASRCTERLVYPRQGLRTAYGVGEQAGGALTNSIVELCFTSSVRFLQPGLLLKVARRPAPALFVRKFTPKPCL